MILRVWDVTFTVSDLQRAIAFYRDVLGLELKYAYSNYAGLDCGGVEIGLATARPAEAPEGAPCVDLLVRGLDEAFRELSERGVRFLKEPHETAWGSRIALFCDPDGNRLQLVQIDWPHYFAACAAR